MYKRQIGGDAVLAAKVAPAGAIAIIAIATEVVAGAVVGCNTGSRHNSNAAESICNRNRGNRGDSTLGSDSLRANRKLIAGFASLRRHLARARMAPGTMHFS